MRITLLNNKGIAIITVLGIVSVLMVVGLIGTKVVMNESNMNKEIKDVNVALKAAESGVEKALARIANLNNSTNFQGQLPNGALFNVQIQQETCYYNDANDLFCNYTITSTGIFNEAKRVVSSKALAKYASVFKPFAAADQFTVNKTITLNNPFANRTEIYAGDGFDIGGFSGQAVQGVSDLDDIVDQINNLEEDESYFFNETNLDFHHEDIYIPTVSSLNYTIPTCSYSCDLTGVTSSNHTWISQLADNNGDGYYVVCGNSIDVYSSINKTPLVLCGGDITVSSSLSLSDLKIYGDDITINPDLYINEIDLYAQGELTVNGNFMLKDSDISFNVTIAAQGNVTFNDAAIWDKNMGGSSYDIDIFTRGLLTINDPPMMSFINVHGGCGCMMGGSGNGTGGILIVAEDGIYQPYGGTGKNLTIHVSGASTGDILLWSDGDITIDSIAIHGKNTDEEGARTIGIMSSHGNITLYGDPYLKNDNKKEGGLQAVGKGQITGITLTDIEDWANRLDNGTVGNEVLEGLLDQVPDAAQASGTKPTIEEIYYWKVEAE